MLQFGFLTASPPDFFISLLLVVWNLFNIGATVLFELLVKEIGVSALDAGVSTGETFVSEASVDMLEGA